MENDTVWTEADVEELRRDFADVFGGRTVLVTGADGFMGSHLTEALVHLGAHVHAFVRATSSGALNNIWHIRQQLRVHYADLTDRASIDYLVRELQEASDRPYVFHLGAQAHVGESWHRPYETIMANTVGTLNLLQSIVEHGLEVEKFDTAGTSEEYGNVREAVAHHHDFDDAGSLILHERSPINPKSIYATAKVAADFLTMNYHDAYGAARRRHAHVQQLRSATEPALRDRDDHHAGARTRADRARQPRAAARLLLLHRRRARTPDGRGARDPRRRVRLRPGREHLDARLGRADPRASARTTGTGRPGAQLVTTERRFRPGASDVMALRVGYDKLNRETGWEPCVSWEEGIARTIELVREQPRQVGRARGLARAPAREGVRRRLPVPSSPAAEASSARTSSRDWRARGTTSSSRAGRTTT